MPVFTRGLRGALLSLASAAVMSCGGGGGGSSLGPGDATVAPADNVVSVVVDSGPSANSTNTLFTTVTVCVPNTTTCQTIDHIQVDTGSNGLRLLSAVSTLGLPIQQFSDGTSLLECAQFVGAFSWGPVALADVQISGETASSLPVQIIGDSNFATVPAACSGTGAAEDTVATFGANGVLGVGVFEQDCGTDCATNSSAGFYYACSATTCAETVVPVDNQVLNPVGQFAKDNNGIILVLPSVAAGGAATLRGSLVFGIDTESNNASGSTSALTVDANSGYFTASFNGQTLNTSFIDSGSNALYFNDSSLKQCDAPSYTDFYCPASTQSLSATLAGNNGVTAMITFSVANAQTLVANQPTFTVYPTLAGPYPDPTDLTTFDFGLPFFYGRRVINALEAHTTTVGTGPYVAF